jgi:DNA-binding SARP family transcriptional activator
LQSHLTRLRRTLSDADFPATITRRGPGYVLDVDRELVDIHLFRQLRDRAVARDCPPDDASGLLDRALTLAARPALAGIDGEWAERVQVGLETEVVDAAVAWGRAALAIGDHDHVVHRMRDLVASRPLVEPFAELLIRALHGAGRGAEAIENYLATREHLVSELGTEPGQSLRDLYGAVLRDEVAPCLPARTATTPAPALTEGAEELVIPDGWLAGSTATNDGSGTAPATPGISPSPAHSSWPRALAAVVVSLAIIVGVTAVIGPRSFNRMAWQRSAAVSSDSPPLPQTPDKPVAHDDFTGSALSESHWGMYEQQRANGSAWSPSAILVNGGELQIVGAGREPTGRGNVAGGACWCKSAAPVRSYGIWEAQVKFDVGAGYGAMIGLWPSKSENEDEGYLTLARIDQPDRRHAYPVLMGRDGKVTHGAPVVGDYTDWNTYAIEWRPDFVAIRLNGRTILDTRRSERPIAIPHAPMYLYVQTVSGPDGPIPAPNSSTPDRVVLHVDWVKYSA